MDTNALQNFIDIVSQGSIAEVSRRTNLTPAAINQRIRKLEQEVGLPLLVRSGHTLMPTKEGLSILNEAKDILRKIHDLNSVAKSGAIQGQINVGAFDSAMTGIIPKVIRSMCAEHPDISFMLTNGYSVNLYRKVFEGELDAAIVIKPIFETPKNFEWIKIREEPLIVLSNSAFPEKDAASLLRQYPLVGYDRNLSGGHLAVNYLRQIGVQPRIRCELASVETIALLVSMGLGVAVVPDWASSAATPASLVKIPIKGSFAKSRSIGILWNTQTVRAAAVQKFIDVAQQVCRRHKA